MQSDCFLRKWRRRLSVTGLVTLNRSCTLTHLAKPNKPEPMKKTFFILVCLLIPVASWSIQLLLSAGVDLHADTKVMI